MRLALAPMEGLADYVLRDILTQIGGYDFAVSEFIRVSGSVLPSRTFLRVCPEIALGSQTPVGTPLRVQLLGSDPDMMARNAARLATFASNGIDLNFGCPAKTVNRHGGGAMLLAEPERMYHIAEAVRRVVPASISVTAKMRLGVSDTHLAVDCAQALAAAGVAALVVHARTRDEGYRPPAHWPWIARIQSEIDVPVMANGEVWTPADFQRCVQLSGRDEVMLGRGAVSDPFLARRCRGEHQPYADAADWRQLTPFIWRYWRGVLAKTLPSHAAGRLKLWLGLLRRTWPQAEQLYQSLRALKTPKQVEAVLHLAIPWSAECAEHDEIKSLDAA